MYKLHTSENLYAA